MGKPIPDNFGEGHSGISPASDPPTLVQILKSLAQEGRIGWSEPLVVTGNTVTLEEAGPVLAVDATAGAAPGPKAQRSTGAAAAGEVLVVYDGDGVATLTFNGGDGITEAVVHHLPLGKDILSEV